jgi:hypothetical protein
MLGCADGAEAMKRAKELVDGHYVELQQRDRMIAKFASKPEVSTSSIVPRRPVPYTFKDRMQPRRRAGRQVLT